MCIEIIAGLVAVLAIVVAWVASRRSGVSHHMLATSAEDLARASSRIRAARQITNNCDDDSDREIV